MVQTRRGAREAEQRHEREERERREAAAARKRATEAKFKEMGRRRAAKGSYITAGQPKRLPKGRRRADGTFKRRKAETTTAIRGCPRAQWVPGYYRCAAPWQVV